MPTKKKKEEEKKADLTTVLHIRKLPHLHMKLANNKNHCNHIPKTPLA